jgi:hypothetical protein
VGGLQLKGVTITNDMLTKLDVFHIDVTGNVNLEVPSESKLRFVLCRIDSRFLEEREFNRPPVVCEFPDWWVCMNS